MLNGLKVLEISRPQTMLAGRMLADAADLIDDPDLAADGYYGVIEDPMIGRQPMRNAQFAISPAVTVPARPAPRIGDATDQVLREVAGLSDARIAALRREGVLT